MFAVLAGWGVGIWGAMKVGWLYLRYPMLPVAGARCLAYDIGRGLAAKPAPSQTSNTCLPSTCPQAFGGKKEEAPAAAK